jgi:glycerate kinase
MRFVFASDSFKGSLSSKRIAELLTKAAKEAFEDAECIGMLTADGGEGTVEAVVSAVNGSTVTAKAHDPLGREIDAVYGIVTDPFSVQEKRQAAVIETAVASGLALLEKGERDPLAASTFGTGELIRDAICRGIRVIYTGLGGSATNDGGMGALRALGAKFLDKKGKELEGCGNDLEDVYDIDISGLDERLQQTEIFVMSDVTNPLCGENGATFTFGPQKCANTDKNGLRGTANGPGPVNDADNAAKDGKTRVPVLERLEKGMRNYKEVLIRKTGTDPDMLKGAGAAGGLGAALALLLKAKIRSGIETVLELSRFDEIAAGADLVITGEGRLDAQSLNGKTVQGIALHAKKLGVPVYAICGSVAKDTDFKSLGLKEVFTLQSSGMSLNEAMERAEELYFDKAKEAFRFFGKAADILKI